MIWRKKQNEIKIPPETKSFLFNHYEILYYKLSYQDQLKVEYTFILNVVVQRQKGNQKDGKMKQKT